MPILIILAILMLSSCTVNDTDYAQEQAQLIEHSDMVLENATCILSHGSSRPVTVSASRISYWMDEQRMEAEGISFSQPGEEGNEDISGSADRAVIDTEAEIMTLEGNVELSSISSSLSISTSRLIFDTGGQTVTTDARALVTFEDGSIAGTGLDADLARMRVDIGFLEDGEVII